MKEEEIDQCKYYWRAPKFYQQHFAKIVEYVLAHPNVSLAEYRIWYKDNIKKEFGDISNRILADARTNININYYKVDKQDADIHIRDLDDGLTSDLSWYQCKDQKLLILSDIHFPYHDKEALMVALRTGKEQQVDSILLNGDILDFYQLSKFTKDFRKPSIRAELDIFRFFIAQLKQRFPEANIYYKLGNHEVRLDRWIKHNAQMFDGMLDLEHIVDFKLAEIVYLKDNIGIKFGKLNIIHGHEVRANGSLVNIARTYYLKTNSNTLLGHWHQTQEYVTKAMSGEVHGSWATGCLCKLDADYTYGINNWNHGFAIAEITDEQGNFKVKNYRIVSGKVI